MLRKAARALNGEPTSHPGLDRLHQRHLIAALAERLIESSAA
jgi:hypothetical protein